jgi:hypothetical protein
MREHDWFGSLGSKRSVLEELPALDNHFAPIPSPGDGIVEEAPFLLGIALRVEAPQDDYAVELAVLGLVNRKGNQTPFARRDMTATLRNGSVESRENLLG